MYTCVQLHIVYHVYVYLYMHNVTTCIHCVYRFGPLVRHWTMRYEAKHNYFKKLAQNTGNYINLSRTLAKRHQYLQCYYHLSGDAMFEKNTEIGPGGSFTVVCMCMHIKKGKLWLVQTSMCVNRFSIV